MKGEDDGFVSGEEHIEFLIAQSMRMFALWLQLHQVEDIDHPDLQLRKYFRSRVTAASVSSVARRRSTPSPRQARPP